MPKDSFTLINPLIEGQVKTECLASSPDSAMKKIWTMISPYFSTKYPLHPFYMTICNSNDGSMHHFCVRDEAPSDDGGVNFHLTSVPVPEDLSESHNEALKNASKKLMECYDLEKTGGSSRELQLGGKPKRYEIESSSSSDSDSDSSSDEDDSVRRHLGIGKHRNSIIGKFTYFVYPYNILTNVDLPVIVTPVLAETLVPKVLVTYNYGLVPLLGFNQ